MSWSRCSVCPCGCCEFSLGHVGLPSARILAICDYGRSLMLGTSCSWLFTYVWEGLSTVSKWSVVFPGFARFSRTIYLLFIRLVFTPSSGKFHVSDGCQHSGRRKPDSTPGKPTTIHRLLSTFSHTSGKEHSMSWWFLICCIHSALDSDYNWPFIAGPHSVLTGIRMRQCEKYALIWYQGILNGVRCFTNSNTVVRCLAVTIKFTSPDNISAKAF